MTTLYIKTHNVTGLKYFGKTMKLDPHTYRGSGVYWSKHIKEHKNNVTTCVYAQFDEQDYIEKILLEGCALMFSYENDIVNSKEWANLELENGLNGGAPGPISEEARKKREKYSLLKWGTTHPTQNKDVQQTKISTNNERYGYDHVQQVPEIKEKQRQTCLKNLGVDNPSKSDIVKEKKRLKSQEKYGVDNPNQSEEVISKRKETNKLKYPNKKIRIYNINLMRDIHIDISELPEYELGGWKRGILRFHKN